MERMDTILTFQGVTGKKRKFHLRDINLELQAGYIYGLIGENGAGKTTLMKYILDESAAYEGEISMDGEDIKKDHAALMNKIGYVSEDNVFLGDRTGKQNAELLGMFYDTFSMEIFMESMNAMNVSSTKTYRLMSRGEQLKFQLAFAMAHQPSLYLLDEVTAGMDSVFRREFFVILQELIREKRCSVLMTSHILSEIERKTDYVAVMEQGAIIRFGESMDMGEDWRGVSKGEKNVLQDLEGETPRAEKCGEGAGEEMLRRFFKEETTWFPEHVGNNLLAAIFLFISLVMMAIPIQAWEQDDFFTVFWVYAMEWMGVAFYVQNFTNYTEKRQIKSMYKLLRYLPVSRRQLHIFIMKRAIKLCLCMTGMAVLFQGLFTVADEEYTLTAVNILVPVLVSFVIPIGGLAFGMWCSKRRI